MTDLINDGYIAYIGLDAPSDGMVGSAIGSLLIAELTSIAGDRYNDGVNNKPVSVFPVLTLIAGAALAVLLTQTQKRV